MLYPCDPDKNKECSKTRCHINGGTCEHTSTIEYAISLNTCVRVSKEIERLQSVFLAIPDLFKNNVVLSNDAKYEEQLLLDLATSVARSATMSYAETLRLMRDVFISYLQTRGISYE